MNQQTQINSLLIYYDPLSTDRLRSAGAKRRIAGLPSGTGMKGSVELIYDAVTKNEYLYFNQYGLYRSDTDAADQDFAKLVKASGSEYTKIATAGNFGDLRRNVLSTGETVYMASENSAAVNSDLKLPAVGRLGAASGQASYLPSQPFRTVGASGQGYTRSLGRKVYELTDHLGNVHATVSDRRKYDATLKASLPEVKSLADYYPFGMQMPGKKLNPDGYRYGYQGQETDHETGYVNYTYRMHDPKIGRFFAVDPLTYKFPWNSPYAFQENKLGLGVEFEGLELAKQQSPTNDNIPMVVVDANWLKIQSTPVTPDMMAIKLLKKQEGSANIKLNTNIRLGDAEIGVELDGNKQEATVMAAAGDFKYGYNPSSKEAFADAGNITFSSSSGSDYNTGVPFLITGSKKTEKVSFTLGTVESSNVPAAYSYTKTSYEMKMFGLYKAMSTSIVNDATQETIYNAEQEGCSVDPSWQLNDKVTLGGSIELVSPPNN